MKEKRMKTNTKKLDDEIKALMQLRDEDIDTSDIPEVTDWRKAVVGKFYRPIKEPVTIRLDVDVIAWMKAKGPGYQTRINALLRAAMEPAMTGASALEEAVPSLEETAGDEESELVPSKFHFPSLEKQDELGKCKQVAELIKKRGSFFARAA